LERRLRIVARVHRQDEQILCTAHTCAVVDTIESEAEGPIGDSGLPRMPSGRPMSSPGPSSIVVLANEQD
jgi:hypothetical protein